MILEKRIQSFIRLGEKLKLVLNDSKGNKDYDFEEFCLDAIANNGWFTYESIKLALEGIIKYLGEDALRKWLNNYKINKSTNQQIYKSKKVGVIMAGNIPLVGFHDFLTVLLSGHHIHVKLSSQDNILLKKIAGILIEIEPGFKELIHFAGKHAYFMQYPLDAIIATGSGNSARYFEYYFRNKPHIIRKNRTSCAILDGSEDIDDFRLLGDDTFRFFGLGCRNVSKLFVPNEWNEFDKFFKSIKSFDYITDHPKYANNYQYNKAILRVNKVKHFDNGFLLMTENDALASPISMLYYEHYRSLSDLNDKIKLANNKIQCIVSRKAWHLGSIEFAETQRPYVWDYADGVDTMKFLLSL